MALKVKYCAMTHKFAAAVTENGNKRAPVVRQQTILEDEPSLLVSFQVVRPFVQPALVLGLVVL